MSLANLLTEIYKLTNRSDLVDETTIAVKSATLKAHMSDYYTRDISETVIDMGSAAYLQTVDYGAEISNFRSLKYIRKYDNAESTSGDFVEVIAAEEVMDSYNIERVNVGYIAGVNLLLKLSTEEEHILVGAYTLPVVTDGGYSSWVDDQYPYVIIYEAARVVFKMTGDTEQSNTYRDLAREQLDLMMRTAISDVGY